MVINTSPDSAYPRFSELARRRDVLQTVSIGLSAQGTVSAGLNIYVAHDRPFDRHAMSRAGALANYARVAVAQLRPDETAGVADRDDFAARAADVYGALCAHPDVRGLYAASEILHEVPFTLLHEGAVVRGTIDCLVRTGPADRASYHRLSAPRSLVAMGGLFDDYGRCQ